MLNRSLHLGTGVASQPVEEGAEERGARAVAHLHEKMLLRDHRHSLLFALILRSLVIALGAAVGRVAASVFDRQNKELQGREAAGDEPCFSASVSLVDGNVQILFQRALRCPLRT